MLVHKINSQEEVHTHIYILSQLVVTSLPIYLLLYSMLRREVLTTIIKVYGIIGWGLNHQNT